MVASFLLYKGDNMKRLIILLVVLVYGLSFGAVRNVSLTEIKQPISVVDRLNTVNSIQQQGEVFRQKEMHNRRMQEELEGRRREEQESVKLGRIQAVKREQEEQERKRIQEELEALKQQEQQKAVLEPEVEIVVEDEEKEPEPDTESFTEEAQLLARLVEAEAQGEPYVGKVAVAEVVLNRVRSNQFPNTITGVIYDAGQFSPTMDGRINITPSAESYTAVAEAMAGSNYTAGSLYFYNPRIAEVHWHGTMVTKAEIGNHVFK